MVRFALIGAGRIGVVHAKSIAGNNNAKLTAVSDSLEKSANIIASLYACEARSIREIETAKDIDAVVICTPTDTHAELIELFSVAGKSIFCEKPIDLDINRVRHCLDVVSQSGGQLMVGFNRRFDPHFCAVKQAIEQGKVGDVEMIQITSRDPGAPDAAYIKTSGGLFNDMTIHDFDMARFLLPEEPMEVFATASVLTDASIKELNDYDSASIILTTASGQHCSISNSRRAAYGYDQRVEVHGSKGMVAAENQRPVSIEIATKSGFERPPLHDFFMTRYTEAYASEIASFISSMTTSQPFSPSGQDGLQALLLAKAAMISVAENRSIRVADVG